jgi:hypothetical protein
VRVAAVELDDQSRRPPEHVRPVAADPCIRLGDRQPVALAEQDERALEPVGASRERGEVGVDGGLQLGSPAAAAAEDGLELAAVEQPLERPGRGRGGASPGSALRRRRAGPRAAGRREGRGGGGGRAASAATPRCRRESGPGGRGDVDAPRAAVEQSHPPEPSEGRERCARAGEEECDGQLALCAQVRATPGEHPRPASMQPAESLPRPDLGWADAGGCELAPGDDAELPRGQLARHLSCRFGPWQGPDLHLTCHARTVASPTPRLKARMWK